MSKTGLRSKLGVLSAVMMTLAVATPSASVRLEFPGESPGPPFYALISDLPGLGLEASHTDEWAAIPFLRDPACVPAGFNLLTLFDVPSAFGCALTVQGFELRRSLDPQDISPTQVRIWGLGQVPIFFVSWEELQAAAADAVLTMPELESLPSLRVGYADYFSMEFHPWSPGDDTRGANVQISARGTVEDVGDFRFQVSGVHVPKQSKHVAIVFR